VFPKLEKQLEETIRGLGPTGPRAADLLIHAADFSVDVGPRTGDLIAYCCREALSGILQLEDEARPVIRDLIQDVITAAQPNLEAKSGDLLEADGGDGSAVCASGTAKVPGRSI
jgi:hypothetical protein